MGKTVLITFADCKMRPTLQCIRKEAEDSRFFDQIHTCSNTTFDAEYWRKYRDWYKSHPRGFGYWCWKPYLIRRELSRMDEGDILVYLDAGCVINGKGHRRFADYLELAHAKGIVCFDHTRCFVKQYTKADLLAFKGVMKNDAILSSRQLMAGILVIEKNEKTGTFVNEWFTLMHRHPELIDDTPSSIPNLPDYIEHRHDQSVFTLLAYESDIAILPQTEVYPTPCDWSTMEEFPFWAARRKVFAQPSL